MKAAVSARLAEPARVSTTRRSKPPAPVLRTMRRERPVTSATMLRAEALDDLVKRAGDRRQAGQIRDQRVAAGDCLAALDRAGRRE